FKGTAPVDAVTGTTDDPLGIARDDVARGLELLGAVDDAVAQQEAVDGFQRNGRDGFGHRRGTHGRRQLDGTARGAAIEYKPRLTIDIDQAEIVARVDQMRLFNLRVGVPQLGPFPGLTQKSPGYPPERIPLHHRVLLGV